MKQQQHRKFLTSPLQQFILVVIALGLILPAMACTSECADGTDCTADWTMCLTSTSCCGLVLDENAAFASYTCVPSSQTAYGSGTVSCVTNVDYGATTL